MFDDLGGRPLKKIARPLRVYEIAPAAIQMRLKDLGAAFGQLRMAGEGYSNAPALSRPMNVRRGRCWHFLRRNLATLQLVRRRGSPRLSSPHPAPASPSEK
jgi:hypothetical protein